MTIAESIQDQTENKATTTTARIRLAASAGIAAGLGIVAGHALTIDPNLPTSSYIRDLSAHHTTGVIGGLLTSVGASLLIPAMTALLTLVRGTGARLATAAAILIGCGGAALGAGDVMITLVMGSLVQHRPDTAATMVHVANNAPLLGLPFTFAPLLVVGFVILGVALLRAKTVPAWQAILLGVGGLLVFMSPGGGLVAAATLTPLGAALVLLGRRTARGL